MDTINLLYESTGSNGLRRRIEIETEKSNIRLADNEIDKINKIKEKTRSKNKLAKMDERIDTLNGLKNRCERDMKRSEGYLDNKGKKSKENINKFGKEYAINQARLKTNVDKGVAEAIMRDRKKKSQNESIEIATLLTEAAELLSR